MHLLKEFEKKNADCIQVITKNIICLGSMSSCVKPLRPKRRQTSTTRGKEHEGTSNEEGDTGFGLEFTLTLPCGFQPNNKIFLQQH